MCLEESFCPFTRDALNFRHPKIYDAPPSSVTLPYVRFTLQAWAARELHRSGAYAEQEQRAPIALSFAARGWTASSVQNGQIRI